jgi:hypothetical protein
MFTEAPQTFRCAPEFNHLPLKNEWWSECTNGTRNPERPKRPPENEASQEEARNEEHR